MKAAYSQYPDLLKTMARRQDVYNETTAYIREKERRGEVFVIRPEAALKIKRVEHDRAKIQAVYDQGAGGGPQAPACPAGIFAEGGESNMTESAREACLQGLATEWRTMTYTWRDCALYALAVGAGGQSPSIPMKGTCRPSPTFGATPYWGDRECHPQTAPAPVHPGAGGGDFETRAVLCQPGV